VHLARPSRPGTRPVVRLLYWCPTWPCLAAARARSPPSAPHRPHHPPHVCVVPLRSNLRPGAALRRCRAAAAAVAARVARSPLAAPGRAATVTIFACPRRHSALCPLVLADSRPATEPWVRVAKAPHNATGRTATLHGCTLAQVCPSAASPPSVLLQPARNRPPEHVLCSVYERKKRKG
jgi:hypothetical protein